MIEVAADELSVVLEEAGARTGILRVTERSYLPGRPVRISVRRRGHRYDIDDMGSKREPYRGRAASGPRSLERGGP